MHQVARLPTPRYSRQSSVLTGLVPEIERQNEWNYGEGITKTHPPDTVSQAESAHADQALNAMSLHRAQNISGALRQNSSWVEESFVAEGGNYHVLPAHRRLHRIPVEDISLNDL